MTTQFDVVVVGAGYAGVTAANRLARHPEVAVTVVNPRPVFVERTRLHQVAAGSGSATHSLAGLLHPRASLRVGTAERIEPDAVTLTDGAVLRCDAVVYAVGSGPATGAAPGMERAFSVSDLESATALHTALAELPAHAPVVVVGGGFTGIEVAAELASEHPGAAYSLVGDPGAGFPDGTRQYVNRTLDSFGIDVRSGVHATHLTEDAVLLDDGTAIPAALVVWAGGFSVPDLARRSGLPVDGVGRLRVDTGLQSTDGTAVVGVGDAVTVAGQDHIRMSCQAAMPLGAHGADTVWEIVQGRAPQPLSLRFVAQCLSLGRRRGAVQFTARDDTPSAFSLRGRVVALVKESILRGTILSMRRQARAHDLRSTGGQGAGLTRPVRSAQ
ncbi:NAD(P)/FAD-dependent oxidoreductase [Rhodococcus sp. (in: high G+C Gram-positive bacteria)]|uniref:NAD(P)/FAD-dependent oxidoreductase n=1 Tax=Rhodococcus sp. TaxID=1831 RepID=UPI00389039E7